MTKLKIDEELKNWLPPLAEEEFAELEQSILNEGCDDPICIWNGYIIDGHNRYAICTKHNIEFKVKEKSFDTKNDVLKWMLDRQINKRNVTQSFKIQMAEKYRDMIEREAKGNKQLNGGDKKSDMQKSATPIDKITTRAELAKKAGMSHDTYTKGKKINDVYDAYQADNVDLTDKQVDAIEKYMRGEMKVNTVYNLVFPKPKKEDKVEVVEIVEEEVAETEVLENKTPQKDKAEKKSVLDQIIKSMKTEVNAMDMIDVQDDLDTFCGDISLAVSRLHNKIFDSLDYNLKDYMNNEDVKFAEDKLIGIMEEIEVLLEKIIKENI